MDTLSRQSFPFWHQDVPSSPRNVYYALDDTPSCPFRACLKVSLRHVFKCFYGFKFSKSLRFPLNMPASPLVPLRHAFKFHNVQHPLPVSFSGPPRRVVVHVRHPEDRRRAEDSDEKHKGCLDDDVRYAEVGHAVLSVLSP